MNLSKLNTEELNKLFDALHAMLDVENTKNMEDFTERFTDSLGEEFGNRFSINYDDADDMFNEVTKEMAVRTILKSDDIDDMLEIYNSDDNMNTTADKINQRFNV